MGFLNKLFGKEKRASSPPKVVMIGLDGTPCSTLKELLDAGVMPNFKSLVGEGTLRQMDASTPAISSISWTSFMTGKNPAKHRIFGFIDLEPGTYEYKFPNYQDMASETLWDVLGKSGRKSIVINQPSTYPAKPLNGISIAGFVAIDLKKAVYPPSILPKLEKSGYRIDVDSNKAHDDIDAFIMAVGSAGDWLAAYSCGYYCANDINCDGEVNSYDIDWFIQCVGNGFCQPCP